MKVLVEKWDDDLAIRIPGEIAAEAGIAPGTPVEIAVVGGRLVLHPTRRRLQLAERLEEVTPERLHGEIDFGPPVGNEAW